ncbi:SMI1/KNR4 family protein [Deinococcus cellulosilyticus]|uniref:SMI1/KNR4 family protein n=1 Tax=Deinococcus cellulosilyticus TaxID=401558 RepID=UPI003530CE5F
MVDADFEGTMVCDGVRSTRPAREVVDFPRHLFLIMDDEGKENHCLDCSERTGGSVVVWDTHEQKVPRELAGGFSAYLEDVVNRVLERKGF